VESEGSATLILVLPAIYLKDILTTPSNFFQKLIEEKIVAEIS
jgi:hypothetical protein